MRFHAMKAFGVALALALVTAQAHAASRTEMTVGAGLGFYSGAEKTELTPSLAPQLGFAGNIIFSKALNLVNHFNIGYLMASDSDFAGENGAYSGYAGFYNLALRLNFAQQQLQPYFELGPVMAIYAVTLTSASAGISKNQSAFKYGYSVGLGVDWINGGKRGDGEGWGMGFNYFYLFKSPASLEFSAGKLGANGVTVELRRNFGVSK